MNNIQKPKDLITFVCCIEYGRLEKQTIMLAKTLRELSGSFSECRLIAVVGRFGASLSKDTHDCLDRLNVELVYAPPNENNFTWFNYANKIAAVSIAQKMAITPMVGWLDSDMFFIGQPDGLLLQDDEDVRATFEYLDPVVTDDYKVHLPYWEKLCTLMSIDISDMPYYYNEFTKKRQILSLNSGAFTWRKSSTFAAAYKNTFEMLLNSRLARYEGNFYTADQVILGPIIVKEGLRWRHLDYPCHHITIPGEIEGPFASPSMNQSKLVHYSYSLSYPDRDRFMKRLNAECAHIVPYIHENDSLELKNTLFNKVLADYLKFYRGLVWKYYSIRTKRAEKGAS